MCNMLACSLDIMLPTFCEQRTQTFNEWYATGTSTEGWHVALDSLLIGDQTMLIDQQLASTAIPQHAGHMVFGGSICLKFQCFVCSPEETLAFFPVNIIPKAPFRLVALGIPRLCGQPRFDSRFNQTNHCTQSKAGNG